MKFCSTRNRDLRVTSAQAILRGLSEDGGLYTPAELPAFLPEEIEAMPRMDYRQVAETVLARFLPDDTQEELHTCVREVVTRWHARTLEPMEGMGALVRELKDQGYGIYLLSNASVDLRRYFHRIPGSACFDGLMVSAEEKKLKPHYDIFYALYERFGLIPEACVFIDDGPANVEAAMCTGMHAIQFRGDVGRLRRELRALGVDVALATDTNPAMV